MTNGKKEMDIEGFPKTEEIQKANSSRLGQINEVQKDNSSRLGQINEEPEIKKKKEKFYEAILNIYTSFNNTIAHVTDMSGKTISKVTGGMMTKQDRLKANPTVGMFIAKRISEEVKEIGIKAFYVRIRAKTGNPAPGPGANAIIKSLSRDGFKILNILETTRIARGGPKKKGGRRGRRP